MTKEDALRIEFAKAIVTGMFAATYGVGVFNAGDYATEAFDCADSMMAEAKKWEEICQ